MYLMAFYINGTERAYRAEILASAASDTALGIYGRNLYSIGCVRINRYHGYRSCRAMSCTIAAMHSFSRCDTPLRQPYRMTCLYGCAFFLLYWNNCSYRTYIAAYIAFGATVAVLITYFRLHEMSHVGRWAKNSIGTVGNTELACRASSSEVLVTY